MKRDEKMNFLGNRCRFCLIELNEFNFQKQFTMETCVAIKDLLQVEVHHTTIAFNICSTCHIKLLEFHKFFERIIKYHEIFERAGHFLQSDTENLENRQNNVSNLDNNYENESNENNKVQEISDSSETEYTSSSSSDESEDEPAKGKSDIKTAVSNSAKVSTVDSIKKTWMCEICGKIYSNYNSFAYHKNIHATQDDPSSDSSSETYTCDICNTNISSYEGIKRHISRIHLNAFAKTWCCSVCGKVFTSRSSYMTHTKIHQQEKIHRNKMPGSQHDVRKTIREFYNTHPHWPKSMIVRHFETMDVSRTNIYKILRLLENKMSIERKSGSGRKTALDDPKLLEKIQLAIRKENNVVSYRKLGRKFGFHPQTIKACLQRNGINIITQKHGKKENTEQSSD